MPTKLQPDLRALFSLMGSIGGRARKKALTPERRREIAKQAANARWAKWRAKRHVA